MAISISNGAGPAVGGFFKPAEHQSATVILFEPKEFRGGVETNYGTEDHTLGDITIFLSDAELAEGKPSTLMENAVAKGNIGRSLVGYIGGATVGKLGQVPTKKGNPAWVINPVDQAKVDQVIKYVEDRDALPDFLS